MYFLSIRLFLVLFLVVVVVPVMAQSPSVPARDADVVRVVEAVRRERLERTVRKLASFPTRHTLSGKNGADAAADWLFSEFQAIATSSGGRLQVEKDTWVQPAGTRIDAPATLTNVVATLPGTAPIDASHPERILIVSGHYDSRVTDVMNTISNAPGANDDASGVAVVLELARVMAGNRYPCTIVFAAVTGEEQGLYGATHLAERFAKDKRNIIAMFTNDIVGNSQGEDGTHDDRHLRIFSAGYDPMETKVQASRRRAWGTDAETPSRTLARAAVDAVRRYVKSFTLTMVYRNDRYGRGGDHSPFLEQGYAACRFTEPNENWQHQHQDLRTEKGIVYGDLPEYVDYVYLARVAQANAAVIAEVASAPPSPLQVQLKGDLSAKTTLRWDVAEDTAAVEILWRKTTSADWEGSRRVPALSHTAVLSLSKDDYLFAVRAVGKSGARSLPSIPVGGR